MAKKRTKRTYSVLYGFRGENDQDTVGYAAYEDGEWTVVDDVEDAKLFENENYRGIKGWGSPEQWRGYVDEEIPPWKFHVVATNLTPAKEKRKR